MPLPLPSIPWWVIAPSFGVVVIGGATWFVWDYCPNTLRKLAVRGEDGWYYYVVRGQNKKDATRNDVGNAAQLVTSGPVMRGFLVFNGFKQDASGMIVEGESDLGFYGLHFLHPADVIRVETNKWMEWSENGQLLTLVRRQFGFSVKLNAMAFRTKPAEDKGNVPFSVEGEIYWKIVNPEKAKRLANDANFMGLGVLETEIIDYINSNTIFRIERDDKGKLVSANIDKQSTINKLIDHLKAPAKGIFATIEDDYGYRIDANKLAIHDIIPLAGFAELLALGTKTDLEGAAGVRAEMWVKEREFIKAEARANWSKMYKENSMAFVRDLAEAIIAHGVPIVGGLPQDYKYLVPGLFGEKMSDDVLEEIKPLLKKALKELGGNKEKQEIKEEAKANS